MPATAVQQHETRRRAPHVIHTGEKATGRQIFRVCRLLLEIADLKFPETRGDASKLIDHLEAQRDALVPAATSTDDVPF